MAQPNYRYKYKPTAVKMFKPAKPKTTEDYLKGQVSNLEKRFEGVGVNPKQPKSDVDKRNLIEKALNLTQDQNVLMDILEVLDRPRQVVANVLSSVGAEDKRNILEAAWDGLAGRKKLSTREALQKLTGDKDFLTFKEDDKSFLDEIGQFVVDVGLDMVSDPTTYLPAGFISKQVGKVAGAAGDIAGAGIKAAKGSSNQIISKTAGVIDDVVKKTSKYLDDIGYAFNATKGLTDDNVRAIKKISAEAGQTADELKQALDDIKKVLENSGIKDADRIASEIIQSQSTLVKGANGAWSLVTPDGKLVMSDIMDEFFDAIKKRPVDGTTAGKIAEKILPGFNLNKVAPALRKSFESMIDDVNRVAGKKLFAFRVGEKGSTALQFLGTADEFGQVMSQMKALPSGNSNLFNTIFNFGKRELSDDVFEAVAKNGEFMNTATERLRKVNDLTRKFLSQMDEFNVGDKVFKSNVEYLRRVPTAGAEEFFKSTKAYVASPFSRPGTSDLVSRTYEGTTKEINAALKDLYGATGDLFNESAILSIQDLVNVAQKRYNQTELTKMFLGLQFDPATKTYIKTADAPKFFINVKGTGAKEVAEGLPSGYKAISKGGFKEEFSNLYKNLPKEMQEALDNDFLQQLQAAAGAGETTAMQKSAYNIFKNVDNAYREVPEFIKVYDNLMTKWKSVTLLSPGFHARNAMGNGANMYLAGMNTFDIFKYQTEAIMDLMRYKKLARLRAGGQVLNAADNAFLSSFDEVARSGVLTGHRGARDLESVKEMVERLGQGKQFKDKNILDKLIESNFNLSEEIDDVQRIALYKWAYKKTGNAAGAFKKVREALFDYTLLTPFERDVMKRAIPFYTFLKNNLIFQSKNILENPNQYAKLLRGYKHWTEGMTDMDINELPDYMSQNMWLPIPMLVNKGDTEKINFLKMNLPPSDFAELVADPFKKGVSSLTAPVKIAIELGTGRDSFTGAPLKDFPGQENRMQKDTGVLSGLRGKDGDFYLSGDPVIQKIADDLGLRNPRRLVTALLSIADTATGQQSPAKLLDSIGNFIGVTEAKDLTEIQITSLYQKLEELRNFKKLYEQQTGQKLPTLKDIADKYGYKFKG